MVDGAANDTVSVSMLSLVDVFATIQGAIEHADAPEEIESLHRRVIWLVKIINSPAWERNFGDDIAGIRQTAAEALAETTRLANRRALDIGAEVSLDVGDSLT